MTAVEDGAASIKDIVAQLGAVLDKTDNVRALVGTAAELIDDATALVAEVMSGSSADDTVQALAWFTEAQQTVQSPLAPLSAADAAVKTYRANLLGDGATSPRRDELPRPPEKSPAERSPAKPVSVTAERVEQLRRELPPPVVSGIGQKTHGRWIDRDGNVHREVSGKDEKSEEAVRFFEEEIKSRRIPATVVDVEIKLAAHMCKNGIRSATLVINNMPCRGPMGCNALVPVVLPPGYTMIVHGPNGFRQEYRGGGTSKWVP